MLRKPFGFRSISFLGSNLSRVAYIIILLRGGSVDFFCSPTLTKQRPAIVEDSGALFKKRTMSGYF